jgi:hypothetical protein
VTTQRWRRLNPLSSGGGGGWAACYFTRFRVEPRTQWLIAATVRSSHFTHQIDREVPAPTRQWNETTAFCPLNVAGAHAMKCAKLPGRRHQLPSNSAIELKRKIGEEDADAKILHVDWKVACRMPGETKPHFRMSCPPWPNLG